VLLQNTQDNTGRLIWNSATMYTAQFNTCNLFCWQWY